MEALAALIETTGGHISPAVVVHASDAPGGAGDGERGVFAARALERGALLAAVPAPLLLSAAEVVAADAASGRAAAASPHDALARALLRSLGLPPPPLSRGAGAEGAGGVGSGEGARPLSPLEWSAALTRALDAGGARSEGDPHRFEKGAPSLRPRAAVAPYLASLPRAYPGLPTAWSGEERARRLRGSPLERAVATRANLWAADGAAAARAEATRAASGGGAAGGAAESEGAAAAAAAAARRDCSLVNDAHTHIHNDESDGGGAAWAHWRTA
jgi:hypothetical protein